MSNEKIEDQNYEVINGNPNLDEFDNSNPKGLRIFSKYRTGLLFEIDKYKDKGYKIGEIKKVGEEFECLISKM